MLPGVAPVAILEGRYVANSFAMRSSTEKRPLVNARRGNLFHYWIKAAWLDRLGAPRLWRSLAMFTSPGFLAWLAWLFRPYLFPDRFSKPSAGSYSVGMVLFHVRARGAADRIMGEVRHDFARPR